MKKTAIMLFLITIMLFPVKTYPNDGFLTMVSAFEKSSIEFSGYDINGNAKLEKQYGSRDDMESLAKDILNFMSLEYTDTRILYDAEKGKMTVDAVIPGGTINVVISSQKNIKTGNYDSTASLSITRNDALQNINNTGKSIFDCLQHLGTQPSINLCITGYSDGRIPESRKDSIINGMMSYLRGKKVDSIDYNGLESICGYSDYIPYFINYSGNRVNFNIASRYSSFDDRTLFWIGTPIINIEY